MHGMKSLFFFLVFSKFKLYFKINFPTSYMNEYKCGKLIDYVVKTKNYG